MKATLAVAPTWPSRIAIGAIRFYQLSFAFFCPGCCRFAPSCSHYGMEAIERHGLWRGLGLALARIARCNPWGGSGYDPVPPARPTNLSQRRFRRAIPSPGPSDLPGATPSPGPSDLPGATSSPGPSDLRGATSSPCAC
jgi:uncharacterized protein